MIGDLFTVTRSIPPETLRGLVSGKYDLAGSVIRHAAGTSEGGQIVRHLLPTAGNALTKTPVGGIVQGVGGVVNTYQLHQIGGQVANLTAMTQALTQLTTATMVLSGLSLGVSLVGFSIIIYQLKQQTKILKEIQRDTKWIKGFLESGRRAKLFRCLEELDDLPKKASARTKIIETSRTTLGEAIWHYALSIDNVSDVDEAMAIEAEYSLALLALSRCTAELELFDVVESDFQRGIERWRKMAISIGENLILQNKPQRFFAPYLIEAVPTTQLLTWMDFVNQEKRGIEWLDELRKDLVAVDDPWFSMKSKLKEAKKLSSYMDRLVARDGAFEGYLSQYRYTSQHKRTPSKVESEIERHLSRSGGDEMVILEPIRRQVALN